MARAFDTKNNQINPEIEKQLINALRKLSDEVKILEDKKDFRLELTHAPLLTPQRPFKPYVGTHFDHKKNSFSTALDNGVSVKLGQLIDDILMLTESEEALKAGHKPFMKNWASKGEFQNYVPDIKLVEASLKTALDQLSEFVGNKGIGKNALTACGIIDDQLLPHINDLGKLLAAFPERMESYSDNTHASHADAFTTSNSATGRAKQSKQAPRTRA